MHYLQKYILDRLRFEQPLSYSAMLPDNVESSLFQYHLKLLQKDGLVEKQGRGIYALTHEGQAALEYMSIGRTTQVRMPKVITYTLLTHKGQALLLRKQKEPYRNLLELIGGKLHFGESAEHAAQRDVHEKSGLSIPLPVLAGVANVMILQQGKPLTHMIVYVHTRELAALPQELPVTVQFYPTDSLAGRDDLAPTTLPLLNAIAARGKTPFVLTLNVEL